MKLACMIADVTRLKSAGCLTCESETNPRPSVGSCAGSAVRAPNSAVMPGLVPGIHALLHDQDVDGRDKPGHDVDRLVRSNRKKR